MSLLAHLKKIAVDSSSDSDNESDDESQKTTVTYYGTTDPTFIINLGEPGTFDPNNPIREWPDRTRNRQFLKKFMDETNPATVAIQWLKLKKIYNPKKHGGFITSNEFDKIKGYIETDQWKTPLKKEDDDFNPPCNGTNIHFHPVAIVDWEGYPNGLLCLSTY